MNLKIKEVVAEEDYKLKIVFKNGEQNTYDCSGLIDNSSFLELKDKEYFNKWSISDGTVVWYEKQEGSSCKFFYLSPIICLKNNTIKEFYTQFELREFNGDIKQFVENSKNDRKKQQRYKKLAEEKIKEFEREKRKRIILQDWHQEQIRIKEEKLIEQHERLQREKQRKERLRIEAERKKKEEQRLQRLKKIEEREKRQKEEEQKLRKKREKAIAVLRDRFQSDFLSADDLYKSNFESELSQVKFIGEFRKVIYEGSEDVLSQDEYRLEKIRFVQEWAKTNSIILDREQAECVGEVNGNVQVIARAGSGKTRTLVNRTFFLLKHCNIPAEQILILAFNRKAVGEVSKRLLCLIDKNAEKILGEKLKTKKKNRPDLISVVSEVAQSHNIRLPHIMTFHSLAYSIVHPTENLIYNKKENPVFDEVVHSLIEKSIKVPEMEERVKSLMLAFFKDDWEKIINSGHGKNREEFLEHLRSSLNQETLNGDRVKSYGEKAIANFLFEYGIGYAYEKGHRWGDRAYHPDFTLKQHKVVIEYFGLRGDEDYDEEIEKKREYWKTRPQYKLIELYPQDITNREFESIVKDKLKDLNIVCVKLTEDELWKLIKIRAVSGFTETVTQFISRCRQLFLLPKDIASKVEDHGFLLQDMQMIEKRFYEIACEIYENYLDVIKNEEKEDFNGLIQRAVEKIANGQILFSKGNSEQGNLSLIKYVFIDEFQDFSYLFWKLTESILQQSPQAKAFCVGDDWQAINRFAGADLKFFENFESYFEDAQKLTLSTNYRSAKSIVDVGNELMTEWSGKPSSAFQAFEGEALVADTLVLEEYCQSHMEKKEYSFDTNKSALIRLVTGLLNDNLEVVILCRTNTYSYSDIKDYLNSLKRHFAPDLRKSISISTSHQYKGLERDAVIVFSDEYPFVHPYWVFGRLFGDSLESVIKDEQRLFYMALTRAEKKLVVVTKGDRTARKINKLFFDKIKFSLPEIQWNQYLLKSNTSFLSVRITGTRFETKDDLELGKEGYRYDGGIWLKSVEKEGFNVGGIQSENWAKKAVKLTIEGKLSEIAIQILDDSDESIAKYNINKSGEWICDFDNMASFCRVPT